jgi:hypothetical protein
VSNGLKRLSRISIDHDHAAYTSSYRSCMLRLIAVTISHTVSSLQLIGGSSVMHPGIQRQVAGIGMDQIPNNEGAANQICGGHLPPNERKGRSPRC